MTATAPEAMKMMNSSKATMSKILITSRQKITGKDRDHDYDCLDVSYSRSAALKCEHGFTSWLPRARLDAASVVQCPSTWDRDE